MVTSVSGPARPNQSSRGLGALLRFFDRLWPWLITATLFGGLALIQVEIGGTRAAYAFPGYVVVGLTAILTCLSRSQRLPPANRWCLLFTLVFGGYLLGRSWFSPVPFLARTNLALILAAIGVYLTVAIYIVGVRQRLALFAGVVGLEIAHLIYGVNQFARGNNELAFGLMRADYGHRASGLYFCPNHLAGFLECTILVLLALAMFARVPLWLRVVAFYAAVAGGSGLLITGSRGGYISFAAGFLVLMVGVIYSFRKIARDRFWRTSALALVAVVIAASAAAVVVVRNPLLQQRTSNIFSARDIRPRLWDAAWKQFELEPAIGTGAGTYQYYGRLFRDASVQVDPVYAHNDMLQLAAEYGLVAVLFAILFLGVHLGNAIQFLGRMLAHFESSSTALSSSFGFTLGGLAAVVAISVHSFVDFNLQIPGNTIFTAVLLGFLANPGAVFGDGERKRVPLVRGLAPAVVGIALLSFVLPRWTGEMETEAARQASLREAYSLALFHAKQAVRADPENADAFYYLGEARRQIGARSTGDLAHQFFSDAASAFETGLKFYPMDERLLTKAGLNAAELGDFPRSDQLFQSALHWSPNLGRIYAYLGARFQLQGRYSEAETAYRQALEFERDRTATIGLEETLERLRVPQPSGTPVPSDGS
jgi:O-antigen ligase